jgi:hypothetical protein
MPNNTNFLLGNGERLTSPVTVKKRGGDKNSPYSLEDAKLRITKRLDIAQNAFRSLPDQACPNDEVVAVLTMHPRYTAKSEFPSDLLKQVNLVAIGSRAKRVKPENWGIKKVPETGTSITEEIFVKGTRESFNEWLATPYDWDNKNAIAQITHIEELLAFEAKDKLKGIPQNRDEASFEIVIHSGKNNKNYLDQFYSYARSLDCNPLIEKICILDNITFMPVVAPISQIENLAKFSLVRVVRGMPVLRPFRPDIMKAVSRYFQISLPDADAIDPSTRVVIFDGGLPSNHGLERWVTYIEPPNIGPPIQGGQSHGLGVTSALLFGPIEEGKQLPIPPCRVDHVRVLDVNHDPIDTDYFDVLERVTSHIDANPDYEFISLSIGPDFAIDDDDISAWTAEMDIRGIEGKRLITAAAGNNGERDAGARLNRVQPPADGVNILSVGAANSPNFMWNRAEYSGIGPGRCPGIVKPDGVSFGGTTTDPFYVLSTTKGYVDAQVGTSFAAPYANRSGITIRTQLGPIVTPQMIRTLMIHKAELDYKEPHQVGWGRFQSDPEKLITCEDWESTVLYEGELEPGQHLRVPIPWPNAVTHGALSITATVVISPDIDIAHANAYTQGGLEITFRPNRDKKTKLKDGSYSTHAKTIPFFTPKNILGSHGVYIDAETTKWECSQKAKLNLIAATLLEPVFDIYCHQRQGLGYHKSPKPLKYSLAISVSAPKIPDLYNQVVRQYANVLRPIVPINRIQIQS